MDKTENVHMRAQQLSNPQLRALYQNRELRGSVRVAIDAEWDRRGLPAASNPSAASGRRGNARLPVWVYPVLLLLPFGMHPLFLTALVVAYVYLLGEFRHAPAAVRRLQVLVLVSFSVAILIVLVTGRLYFAGSIR